MTAQATNTPAFFPVKERHFGGFSVDSVTPSPLQIEVSIELNVPQEKAFELVFSGLDSWFTQVSDVVWDHKNSSNGADKGGQNSTRICGFDGKQLFETIAFYDAPNGYAYVVDMEKSTASFPVKNPLGVFLVRSVGPDKSVVTWRQYFNKKLHPAALVIKPIIKNMMMKKNMKNGLIDVYGGRFI